jgi:transcriptional regulator with XRE-family HTH domain
MINSLEVKTMGFKGMEFHGGRLSSRRNSLDIKIEGLSNATGISPAYISSLENGKKNNPSLDVINGLARE